MCGLAGFISSINKPQAEVILNDMTERLKHRGPDSQAILTLSLKNGQILGFAHTLLRIIGKPGEGHQPFEVPGGWLIFNGALYNYRELGQALEAEGIRLKTSTDTEVLAQGLALYGVAFLKRTRGMYAFAFWDRRTEKLILGRDPFGVKPLYLYHAANTLAFASEYKALLPHLPPMDLDISAIQDYLRLRYTPGLSTFFRNLKKVAPGTVQEYDPQTRELKTLTYYETPTSRLTVSEDEIFHLLQQAIDRRAVADVEIGALLSGGIDSGLVCDILQRSVSSLHTYTLQVGDVGRSEVEAATEVANQLGIQNTVIQSQEASLEDLQTLIYSLDDPYGDPIILALGRIFSFIKNRQRVVVTGEGADEIFSGYVHHRALALLNSIPRNLMRLGSWSGRLVPAQLLAKLLPYAGNLSAQDYSVALNRLRSFAQETSLRNFQSIFWLFDDVDLRDPSTSMNVQADCPANLESLRQTDFKQWLPNSQLFKLDKIAMAFSIEAREPYVDIDLIEAVNGQPPSHHIGFNSDKRVMRRVLDGRTRLPSSIIRARKTSFFQPFATGTGGGLPGQLLNLLRDQQSSGLSARFLRHETLSEVLSSANENSVLKQKKRFALAALEIWDKKVRTLSATGPQLA